MEDNKYLLGRSLKLPDIDFGKEGQASGALSFRLVQLLEMLNTEKTVSMAPVSIDPGDYIRIGDDGSPGLSLSLPIAYDVWYLWQTANVLPANREEADIIIDMVLSGLLSQLGGMSILRTISKEILSPGDIPDVSFFKNNGFYCIKEMRFETFLKDRSPEYSSKGPRFITESGRDLQERGDGDIYGGYLAFPVGPLGVMETTALVCESTLDEVEGRGKEYDGSFNAVPGESLFPPLESRHTNLKGLVLCRKAYLLDSTDVEFPAEPMAGFDSILPHHWMRYWLAKENRWPVPGEFVGLIVKPLPVPPHCWWFQETSPFLYSGNWFETDYYTSGIILSVIEPKTDDENSESSDEVKYEVTSVSYKSRQRDGYRDHIVSTGDIFSIPGEKVGNIYKVRVKDQDLYLKSTDFLEYAVDDQVAVVKNTGLSSENFNWSKLNTGRLTPGETVEDIQNYDDAMAGSAFKVNNNWVIVPVTFYKESV